MKTALSVLLCGCVLLMDVPASSEDEPAVDCANAMTQMDMNICAGQDYQAADDEMNAQWRKTRALLAEWDKSVESRGETASEQLLAAQRAWLSYRDRQCAVEGAAVEGGSMQPLIVASCLAKLTRLRTEDLSDLAGLYGN
ncbi:DUF1311 domain-containing protein [Peteryoungia desertarenae]|uniref:DUF1311 domain-containing protein n=1 Tax=Peteryoungia desertarenae TaxID=1813451 RepID=A0ABX6QR57_9HYPH|nr:lysozyme inhibitor LprI family protein [Peteryoungia desertarenae]QLF71089.1 DUF1311 domain-containing protein [Peteryoungia desertarenae]